MCITGLRDCNSQWLQTNWVQNPLRLSSLCKTWLINQIVSAGKARQLPSFRRILPYWASFIPWRNQTHMWFLDARKEGQLHLCPQVNRTFACTWRPWGLATGKHLKNRWSTPQTLVSSLPWLSGSDLKRKRTIWFLCQINLWFIMQQRDVWKRASWYSYKTIRGSTREQYVYSDCLQKSGKRKTFLFVW